MVTCCFLGQSQVYDKDIEKRLNKAVAEIAQANTSVRFLFCGLDADNKASYFDYAFTAVYLAKQANPQKKIFQSIVVEKEKHGSFIAGLCNWRAEVPSFMVDEVLSPPWFQEERTRTAYEQKIRNWIIEKSDYLISYQYDGLCDCRNMTNKSLLTTEKSIIDITTPATRDAVHEKYALLPSQTQAAMELMLEGKTMSEIADALRVNESEAEKLLSQGSRTVLEAMVGNEIRPKKGRCAVFALEPECYENLCLFHTTVRYLILHKNVRTFYVYKLKVSVGDMHTKALGIDNITIGNQTDASTAVQTIKNAINYVSGIRGDLGATQNRLEHTANNLSVMAENIQDAESTIRDTDVAEEMMAYTKNNILIQSAQAMLAQANAVPQGVLQLLG